MEHGTTATDLQILPKTGDDSVFNIIHQLPVDKIDIKKQVRQTFDMEELKELAQSIKENGLIQPIVVRKKWPGKIPEEKEQPLFLYELVTGERRLRAVKLLKTDTIRAIIQDFGTTGEVLQVQIIENLQRKDLHPMEEAWGYNQLVEVNKLTRKQIAEKVGKSLSYIDKRTQLMKLFPEAQKLFRENKFSVSHAIEIARLDAELQKKLVERMFRPYDGSYADLEQTRMFIQNKFMTDLATAVFDRKDSELVKKVGACTACYKNTSCHETLFDDMPAGKSLCTDKSCFNNKTKIFQKNKITKAEEEGMIKISLDGGGKAAGVLYSGSYTIIGKDDKKCDGVKKAILIKSGWDGRAGHREVGSKLSICDDPKCKVHHNSVNKSTVENKKGDNSGSTFTHLGKQLVSDLQEQKYGFKLLETASKQVTEKNLNILYDVVITALINELDSDFEPLLSTLWGISLDKFVDNYDFAGTYKEVKASKLTDKLKKMTQLLFMRGLDSDGEINGEFLTKFVDDNFKKIKISGLKSEVAAEIEGIKITDYKAEIKKCKTDKDYAEVAKKHLEEITEVLMLSGLEKFPRWESKEIWSGKKLVGDIYDLPYQNLLQLVSEVGDNNRECALKLYRLLVFIPEIKKCLGPKK